MCVICVVLCHLEEDARPQHKAVQCRRDYAIEVPAPRQDPTRYGVGTTTATTSTVKPIIRHSYRFSIRMFLDVFLYRILPSIATLQRL